MFFTPGTHKEHGIPYNPFKAIVAPRPIGWISTLSKDGKANLAPYSFFNAISDEPPMVGFSASPDAKGDKDSLVNARETGNFAVNIVSKAQLQEMNLSSAGLAYGDSEFEFASLEMLASEKIAAPRVKGAPCHLECEVWDILALPQSEGSLARNHWVMGIVVGIHIDEQYLNEDGRLDVTRYIPAARLGYKDYTLVEKLIQLARPGE